MFQPAVLGGAQAFLVIQGIDRERLAGFSAGDQVVEVAVGVAGPDLFDDHDGVLCDGKPAMIGPNINGCYDDR